MAREQAIKIAARALQLSMRNNQTGSVRVIYVISDEGITKLEEKDLQNLGGDQNE